MDDDKKTQQIIEDKIKCYHDCTTQITKDKIREEIFLYMSPILDKWIKGILNNRKFYMSYPERLSVSWDCFLFCFDKYNPDKNIPILKHSYTYTKFFFLSWFAKESKTNNNFNAEEECDKNKENDPSIFYDQIDELRQFRDTLGGQGYKQIFDDALLSMAGRPENKVGYVQTTAYHKYKYQEAKKAFKLIIDYLLRR